jgi:DNA polymerase
MLPSNWNLLTIDFETYYDKDYSLTHMTLVEYIRDPRFSIHGVGVKLNDQPTKWMTEEEFREFLQTLDFSTTALLAHNTPFDGFIFTTHFSSAPLAFLYDTLSMARAILGHHRSHSLHDVATALGLHGKKGVEALHASAGKRKVNTQELAEYCINDVEQCYEVFHKLVNYITDDELKLIDMTLRMFCYPKLRIDRERLRNYLESLQMAKQQAIQMAGVEVEDLMSNNRFAEVLRKRGVEPPKKYNPKGELTYAFAKTDSEFIRLLNHDDEQVRNLIKARLLVKSTIHETRAKRLLETEDPLPVYLQYSGAHTHRWSGGDKMNLQNLPRGSELRKSLLAPEGYKLVIADSAQIEARILAWLADQDDLLHAFATGQDVYKRMASKIYNVPVEEVTKEQRQVGKIAVLGLGYGMGATKFRTFLEQQGIFLSEEECFRVVQVYRTQNYKIVALWRFMDEILQAIATGGRGKFKCLEFGPKHIVLPSKLVLYYDGLEFNGEEYTYNTRAGVSKIYSGLLTENIVQALARCVIAEQMLNINEKYPILLTTHDEVVCLVKEEEAEAALQEVLRHMKQSPPWAPGLPLSAEGIYAENYSK